MTDTTLTIVLIATVIAGLATGFFASRWRRKRDEQIARAELEKLAWKQRGCGGDPDVAD